MEVPQNPPFAGDRLEFDLVAQLTYMSGLSTAGLTRDRLFDEVSRLPYTTSGYFRSVKLLTTRLGYNYPRSCEVVAERCKNASMKSFLLRLSGSLGAGEREADFLSREMEVQFENHRNKYERDLESLRKWTDGFVALQVSVALVVIIAIVSMMIFPMGIAFVMGLAAVGLIVSLIGAWVIWRTCPSEPYTHGLPVKAVRQEKARSLAKGLVPISIAVGAGSYLALGMAGISLILSGAILFPVGLMAYRYYTSIEVKDRDVAALLRAVGGVTSAIGTTATEAISRIDLRSMGNLYDEVVRLHKRLKGGIRPDLCWERFVAETGSELIRRSIAVFWDGIRSGGDAGRVGYLASRYAMHVSMLRAKRQLVANTFQWLMVPMQLTLVALMSFITEIFAIFSTEIIKAQSAGLTDAQGNELAAAASLPTSDLLAFSAVDVGFVRSLVFVMIMSLTVVNAFVTNACVGGDRYRFCFSLAIMLVISGVTLTVVPFATDLIFGGLVAGTTTP